MPPPMLDAGNPNKNLYNFITHLLFSIVATAPEIILHKNTSLHILHQNDFKEKKRK